MAKRKGRGFYKSTAAQRASRHEESIRGRLLRAQARKERQQARQQQEVRGLDNLTFLEALKILKMLSQGKEISVIAELYKITAENVGSLNVLFNLKPLVKEKLLGFEVSALTALSIASLEEAGQLAAVEQMEKGPPEPEIIEPPTPEPEPEVIIEPEVIQPSVSEPLPPPEVTEPQSIPVPVEPAVTPETVSQPEPAKESEIFQLTSRRRGRQVRKDLFAKLAEVEESISEGSLPEEACLAAGLKESFWQNNSCFLRLVEELRPAIINGQLTLQLARVIVKLPCSDQLDFLQQVIKDKLTVAEAADRVKERLPQKGVKKGRFITRRRFSCQQLVKVWEKIMKTSQQKGKVIKLVKQAAEKLKCDPELLWQCQDLLKLDRLDRKSIELADRLRIPPEVASLATQLAFGQRPAFFYLAQEGGWGITEAEAYIKKEQLPFFEEEESPKALAV